VGVFKHSDRYIEQCQPSKGTVNVALACPTFGVESKLVSSYETLKVPSFKGKGGAYYDLDTESNAFSISQEHPYRGHCSSQEVSRVLSNWRLAVSVPRLGR